MKSAPYFDEIISEILEFIGDSVIVAHNLQFDYSFLKHEMQRAEGLLIMQASNCNAQIPAKFYEYLRAARPILVVTDPAGDTANAARNAGISAVAALDDPKAISSVLLSFLMGETESMVPFKSKVTLASRRTRTQELAVSLDKLLTDRKTEAQV